MTFQLDTTGAVLPVNQDDPILSVQQGYTWLDLDAFTQGYVEAMFNSHFITRPAFDMLTPETLARIIADCERKVEIVGPPIMRDGVDVFWTAERGARFWRERQADECGENFPPLTVQLGGDGKVSFV